METYDEVFCYSIEDFEASVIMRQIDTSDPLYWKIWAKQSLRSGHEKMTTST